MNSNEPTSIPSRMMQGLTGALILGIFAPVTLTVLYITLRSAARRPAMGHAGPTAADVVVNFLGLTFAAAILCGPGCVLLAWNLMKWARIWARTETLSCTLHLGATYGILFAVVNLPGWLVGFLLDDNYVSGWFVLMQTVTLFAVTGSTCGLWLAWQAWLERHPNAGAIPRFSLRTLVLLALGWGALITLFVPHEF